MSRKRLNQIQKTRDDKVNTDTVLGKLYLLLVSWMCDCVPEQFMDGLWIEEIWNTKDYPIMQYRVKSLFDIPGKKVVTYTRTRIYDSDRKACINTLCWVRFDLKKHNTDEFAELEIKVSNSKKHECFYLSKLQWLDIENNLKQLKLG